MYHQQKVKSQIRREQGPFNTMTKFYDVVITKNMPAATLISCRAHGCKDGHVRGELPLSFCFERICPFITILYPHKSSRLVK